MARPFRSFLKTCFRFAARLAMVWVTFTFLLVLIFKFINPSWNLTMQSRQWQGGENFEIRKTWVPIEKIGKNMQLAAICGEDQQFCNHFGFDFKSMQAAAVSNAKGRKVRGASTISQQTAKNVFLWGGRSYIRKAMEAWFTLLIETVWGKKRIMEVYLNIAETGKGIFGAEAAARHYYKKSAATLTRTQAAAISSILPSPQKWKPGAYPAARRQYLILRAMNKYGIKLTYLD